MHRSEIARCCCRVLIHAAAGGVGLMALQLASSAGAEVLVTAGSASKRGALRRPRRHPRRVLAQRVLRHGPGTGVLLYSCALVQHTFLFKLLVGAGCLCQQDKPVVLARMEPNIKGHEKCRSAAWTWCSAR